MLIRYVNIVKIHAQISTTSYHTILNVNILDITMDVESHIQSLLPILRDYVQKLHLQLRLICLQKHIRYNMTPDSNAKTRTHCNQRTNTSYNSSTTNLLEQPGVKNKLRESTVIANLENPFPYMNSLNKAKKWQRLNLNISKRSPRLQQPHSIET